MSTPENNLLAIKPAIGGKKKVQASRTSVNFQPMMPISKGIRLKASNDGAPGLPTAWRPARIQKKTTRTLCRYYRPTVKYGIAWYRVDPRGLLAGTLGGTAR